MSDGIDVNGAMMRVCERFTNSYLKKKALDMQAYAQENRSWKDKTGNARKLLKGKASFDKENNSMNIALYHRVDYGTYLELANNKKYAILEPTIREFAPEIIETTKKYFGGSA